jgi:hydroxymethylpyrimidine/phosphomethylpyrimidine kinase
MARGLALKEAVCSAKIYITEAIKAGADVSVGKGYGPVNHLFNPLKMMVNEE